MTGHLNMALQVTKSCYKVYVQGPTWNTSVLWLHLFSDFEHGGGFVAFSSVQKKKETASVYVCALIICKKPRC